MCEAVDIWNIYTCDGGTSLESAVVYIPRLMESSVSCQFRDLDFFDSVFNDGDACPPVALSGIVDPGRLHCY